MNATHGPATAMQLSKSRAFPPCLGLVAWVSLRLADLAGGKIGLATAMTRLGAIAGVRCATSCSRGRGRCPGHLYLRLATYRLVGGRRECPHSDGLPQERWPSEHAIGV